MKEQKLIFITVFLLCALTTISAAEASNPVFTAEEDLAYNEFILPAYPDGLRASWNGVYANYLDWHANDSQVVFINKNHEVSTETTSLLAHYAALRGDQATFDEMYDLWVSEAYFLSQKFQLEHWLLDPLGIKYTTDGNYANASGEEVRMLEALKIADAKFTPTGGRNYKQLAITLAEGLKGVNGGQGNFEPLNAQGSEVDDYLLRPWFVWKQDDTPLSTPDDPITVSLNYNNYVSYYYAANWLGDPFYQNVITYTLDVGLNAQNTNPASAGRGLFKAFYNMSTQQYGGENETNTCSTMSEFDIAIRLGAYGHLVGNQQAIDAGKLYLDFIKAKYINDGVIFASYDYNTGQPVAQWGGLVLYSFFARLALEYGDYDLAEKIIREQILPYQVDDASDLGFDEGYYGAFKTPSTKYQAQQNIWKDASAFANLETIITLHKWNTTDKGSWISSYPLNWTTVATVTNSDGGEDIVQFSPVSTRYLKILCKRHALPIYGYSIYTLQVLDPDMTDLALNKKVSTSSVESYDYIGPKAVDNNDSTRWSSEFEIDPQWIYVDLGTDKVINKVRILWEAAYALDYEIQVASTTAGAPTADVVNITKAEWTSKGNRLTIEATSSKAPEAELTTVDFGAMGYDSRKEKYVGIYRGVKSGPGTVTVISTLGGSDTEAVITKR